MTRFFPVWCKGSTGDSLSPGAGSNPATGSHRPPQPLRDTHRASPARHRGPMHLDPWWRIGPSRLAEEALPDGRVYEMVTPPNNQDANVYVHTR